MNTPKTIQCSDPRVVAALQPWAEISERLRRIGARISERTACLLAQHHCNSLIYRPLGSASRSLLTIRLPTSKNALEKLMRYIAPRQAAKKKARFWRRSLSGDY